MTTRPPARLVLENGTIFRGFGFGADREAVGEVVFNTSMTGYQEILTDPSYHGQIVVMTYPEIGNYGINVDDMESSRPWVRGFVVRSLANRSSNFRSNEELDDYLRRNDIPGIYGIDTRKLVRLIRSLGAMKGLLAIGSSHSDDELVDRAKTAPSMIGVDMTREVMVEKSQNWDAPLYGLTNSNIATAPHVVALDFGMKWNIPRHLVSQGCRVTVVPGSFTADQIMELQPDGIFVSNGPGDPAVMDYAVETVKEILGTNKPVFGICLGHQLLAEAVGISTYKMHHGHRGLNHPIKNLMTGKSEITSQNHGFNVVRADAEKNAEVEITHVHLNDNTVAGIRLKNKPAFSVQFHPESSPGPHDSRYLFDDFISLITKN